MAEISLQIKGLGEGLNQQVAFKSTTEKEHMKAVVLCLFQFYKRVELTFRSFEDFAIRRKLKAQQYLCSHSGPSLSNAHSRRSAPAPPLPTRLPPISWNAKPTCCSWRRWESRKNWRRRGCSWRASIN